MNNPPQVKMVRPFAEAEARERERRARKEIERQEKERERQERERERQERERQEQELKQNEEPKTVNMVTPFAEAEAKERERRARKEIERQEREEKERKERIEKAKVEQLKAKVEKANASSDNANKQTSTVIPDQLNITIRTSIPGYQKIEYKPSMTIKDIEAKGVQFNPLVRLNKSIVDKIPDEYKVKQFFNKGLFQSLLNYNGVAPAKNLTYATRSGYVDNNIKVTLDTIFPVNSVIYIGKKPYAIGDFQWSSGDWKIEVKQKKEELDLSKITNPQLYTQLVKEEIISGEQQLNELPQNVVVGNNYRGPPVAAGPPIRPPSTTAQPTTAPAAVTSSTVKPVQPTAVQSVKLAQPTVKPEVQQVQPVGQELVVAPRIPQQPPNQIAEDNYGALPPDPNIISTAAPALTNEPYSSAVEDADPQEQQILDNYIQNLNLKLPNRGDQGYWRRKKFVDFFTQPNFYNIADTIYKKLPHNLREMLINFYRLVTQPKSALSGTGESIGNMYKELCNQCILINPPGDGDCFFAAVSHGINIYNYENNSNKITYNNIYGRTQLFTIQLLREFVFRYYSSLTQEQKDELFYIGTTNANELNEQFRQSLIDNPVNSDEIYIERLNNIYTSNENFLVHKPTRKPVLVDEEETPFRVLRSSEIENYMKSKDYWGDEFAIEAICKILGIYVIPIEKYKSSDGIIRYRAIVTNPTERVIECSSKIIFLYKDLLHYQLIVFIYKDQIPITKNPVQKSYTVVKKYYTIFKKKDIYPPPFHILLLLYGSSYIYRPNALKMNYIFPLIMSDINRSVSRLISDDNNKFIDDFNYIFDMQASSQGSIKNYIRPSLNDGSEGVNNAMVDNPIKGGDPPNRYQPYSYPPYRYPPYSYPPYSYPPYSYPPYGYDSRAITKKPEERDSSKIAYAITIDMELQPGTSLTPQQISESKCNSKYNAIRKAFAEFTGRPYVIPPVYKTTQTKKKVGGKRSRVTRRRY
jgi:hypothetical protein